MKVNQTRRSANTVWQLAQSLVMVGAILLNMGLYGV
jgi:hypothetical protein